MLENADFEGQVLLPETRDDIQGELFLGKLQLHEILLIIFLTTAIIIGWVTASQCKSEDSAKNNSKIFIIEGIFAFIIYLIKGLRHNIIINMGAYFCLLSVSNYLFYMCFFHY